MLLARCAPRGNFRRMQTGVTVIPVSGGLIPVDGEILFALHALATLLPPLLVKAPPIAHVWHDFLDPTESHARSAPRIKYARAAILYCNASSSVQARKTQQTPMHVHVYKISEYVIEVPVHACHYVHVSSGHVINVIACVMGKKDMS